MNIRYPRIGLLALLALALACPAFAQDDSQAGNMRGLIPQHLLGLVHAPEVHQELKLSKTQVQKLEALFAQIDGDWFRARNLPADKQFQTISQLEGRLNQWFQRNASEAQRNRLQQLEYRAQGVRMLLRQDLGSRIGMEPNQRNQLAELAQATNEATQKLRVATMRNQVTEELKQAVLQANQAEQAALKSVMRQEQLQQLPQILGEPFDTSKLKRIYPMAPELVPVDHWINSQPTQLKDLRGKVVVLHFYAFQCHNCHANFGHYTKWHEEFQNDDVVVIGIQTPETSRERDPSAVRAAAADRQLKFPILIDLESKNWAAWSNTMWPTVYVIDKKGYIRQWWQGELNWQGATGDQVIHQLINDLLNEQTEA